MKFYDKTVNQNSNLFFIFDRNDFKSQDLSASP